MDGCFHERMVPGVDFTKSRKSKISRKCEFQPIKGLEITLTITLTINLRLTTFCEIDPWIYIFMGNKMRNVQFIIKKKYMVVLNMYCRSKLLLLDKDFFFFFIIFSYKFKFVSA